jgi:hypothetical protein
MSVECRIHFNTSFRSFTTDGIFLSEGYVDLYGALPLQSAVCKLEHATSVSLFHPRNNKQFFDYPYGHDLKMYPLVDILRIIKKEYNQMLKDENKSSLTVTIGILEAIIQNSSQSQDELVVVLEFH